MFDCWNMWCSGNYLEDTKMKKRNHYSIVYVPYLLWIILFLFSLNMFTANINSLYAQCDPVRIMPLGDLSLMVQGTAAIPT